MTDNTPTQERQRRTPVCRLCGRYLAILGRPIRVTVPAVTVAPTALVGSLMRSSNLPHSLQRGVRLAAARAQQRLNGGRIGTPGRAPWGCVPRRCLCHGWFRLDLRRLEHRRIYVCMCVCVLAERCVQTVCERVTTIVQ